MFLLLVRLNTSKTGSSRTPLGQLEWPADPESDVKNSLSFLSVLRRMMEPSGWMRSWGVLPIDWGWAVRDEMRVLKSNPLASPAARR